MSHDWREALERFAETREQMRAAAEAERRRKARRVRRGKT